jgi:alpha-tubulin suppressor-like RCC1 family protein
MLRHVSTMTLLIGLGLAGITSPAAADDLLSPKLALGGNFAVAITTDGRVIAWGGSSAIRDVPVIENPVMVSAWGSHAVALQADGRAIAWGDNSTGQCDFPADLPPIQDVAAGFVRTWLLDVNGQVYGFGQNYWCGAGSPALDIPSGLIATDVSGGNAHWLYRRPDGTVGGSGCNYNGQLNVPASAQPPLDFEATESWSCVLGPNGQIHAFGYGGLGSLGVPGGTGHTDIATGNYFGLAVTAAQGVVAWGNNSHGQRNVPRNLPPTIGVDAGGNFSAAVHADGTLTLWGQNNDGQLDWPPMERIQTHDPDCDANGVADWKDLLLGQALDDDGDGTIDCCQSLAPCRCPDLDGDGVVGPSDIGLVIAGWSSTGPGLVADVNVDMVVDGFDLAGLLGYWGQCAE